MIPLILVIFISPVLAQNSIRHSISPDEIYLLAKIIHAEARGEPFAGKVAVGAVVLNRVKSKDFPNTISEVIYQPLAFTAINDGQFQLEPNAEASKAALSAINGIDPSNGALFYYNPLKTTSPWIYNRPVVNQIGNHIFAQ
ncbi:cell wall hydrolase [Orenia metallireducens]|uniref:cell wall hydrolase n=1 Tax=Orenia metallireducens TaxID=1413210 RepID=UPI000BE23F3E|nr:cell wall hydrolase [Orenia metallireducens]